LAGLFVQPKIDGEQVTRQFDYVAVPCFSSRVLVGYHRAREMERDLQDEHLQDRFISLEISHPNLATLLSVYRPSGYYEETMSYYEAPTSYLIEAFIKHPNLFTEKNVRIRFGHIRLLTFQNQIAHITRQLIDVLKYLEPWRIWALKGPSKLFSDVLATR
jgi:hypothetical protein